MGILGVSSYENYYHAVIGLRKEAIITAVKASSFNAMRKSLPKSFWIEELVDKQK